MHRWVAHTSLGCTAGDDICSAGGGGKWREWVILFAKYKLRVLLRYVRLQLILHIQVDTDIQAYMHEPSGIYRAQMYYFPN